MDHIVYLDAKAKELGKLLDGGKTMIVRGAAGRKLPHGRVHTGDVLWFAENSGDGLVKASAVVKEAWSSDKLTSEESEQAILERQDKLCLTKEQLARWAGKRYLVLIEVERVCAREPFSFDRSGYGNMDDWLDVGDIGKVRR